MTKRHSVKASLAVSLIRPKQHLHLWKRHCTSIPLFTESSADVNRKEKNLEELSSLGHFLKGSSAALGIVAVQDACEKMQHYGHLRDEEENTDLKEEEALKRIEGLIKGCRKDYEQAKVWLTSLYTEGAFEGISGEGEDEAEA